MKFLSVREIRNRPGALWKRLAEEDLVLTDDLPFLEVAAAGRAEAQVTGNARHYPDVDEVEVVSPPEWLRRLGRGS